ncbi:unnamed protein product [Prorocentrum cordatum]|uniref:Uncharacterized protein n=1 Tax=Prorocentrum cordatum TaxID=2364126 RepID=A0ABN9P6U5_9DINO|nr:unnamed protein product [Polarella glacialis]
MRREALAVCMYSGLQCQGLTLPSVLALPAAVSSTARVSLRPEAGSPTGPGLRHLQRRRGGGREEEEEENYSGRRRRRRRISSRHVSATYGKRTLTGHLVSPAQPMQSPQFLGGATDSSPYLGGRHVLHTSPDPLLLQAP